MNTQPILTAIEQRAPNFGTAKALAEFLGINQSQLSRVRRGDAHQVLSDAKWISMARILGVELTTAPKWETAITPVFEYITAQLQHCQSRSLSGLLVDCTDIGKSHIARHYTSTHANVAHVDCSQVKSKTLMLRAIARAFGVDSQGSVSRVYAELSYFLRVCERPLVILDEAGDLSYEAFLELKALWNATEGCCGWYMMGADGLKAKVERGVGFQKVGYAELFSRYGARYQRITPLTKPELDELKAEQCALVIKANAPDRKDIQQLIRRCDGSLRRVRIELTKAN